MLQQTKDALDLIEEYLNDPRQAVLEISKIKLSNGKKLGKLNAEILYAKGVMYVIKDMKKYRFNNTALVKKCNNLIRRSMIKKKRKKK